MNSFSIAVKMFKTNLKTYGFYLAVMIFAVAVYYDFMVLKFDPGFLMAKEIIMAAKTASSVTSFILVVFLVFFISYSTAFFMKQRKKEIAIYSLMGISSRRIGFIFAIESLFTGIVSIVAGLVVGILFSRLFLMALAKVALLDVVINFSTPLAGIKELLMVFGVIFIILSFDSYFSVARSKLIDLIQDASREEKEPKFKLIRAILSIVLIGAGYAMSKNISNMFIVVVMVVLGTFWLFGALLPAITKYLTQNKSILYKGVRIISISNITFRIKANYRSLAMLAVMTATTITAFGTSLSLKYYVDETHHIEFPYSFSYVLNDPQVDQNILKTIKASKHKLLLNEKVEAIQVKMNIDNGLGSGRDELIAVRYSDFRRIAQDLDRFYPGKTPEFPAVAGNNALVVLTPSTLGGYLTYEGKEGLVGNETFRVIKEMKAPLFGSGSLYLADCLVISDEAYDRLSQGRKPQVFHGLIVSDAKNSLELSKQLMDLMPKDVSLFVYAAKYKSTYTFMGLFYFLGSFMSLVFILATGSIMYFKLLSEALADKSKYEILKKIGMSRQEIKKAVSMQVGLSIIFPLFVGTIHSLFAIDALRKMLSISLVVPAIAAIAVYALCYGAFYAATTRKFIKLVY